MRQQQAMLLKPYALKPYVHKRYVHKPVPEHSEEVPWRDVGVAQEELCTTADLSAEEQGDATRADHVTGTIAAAHESRKRSYARCLTVFGRH